MVAMGAASLLINERGFDFESAVKIVSSFLQQKDGLTSDIDIAFQKELEGQNCIICVEKMDTHLYTSVKAVEDFVARQLKKVDTAQPSTGMDESDFQCR